MVPGSSWGRRPQEWEGNEHNDQLLNCPLSALRVYGAPLRNIEPGLAAGAWFVSRLH